MQWLSLASVFTFEIIIVLFLISFSPLFTSFICFNFFLVQASVQAKKGKSDSNKSSESTIPSVDGNRSRIKEKIEMKETKETKKITMKKKLTEDDKLIVKIMPIDSSLKSTIRSMKENIEAIKNKNPSPIIQVSKSGKTSILTDSGNSRSYKTNNSDKRMINRNVKIEKNIKENNRKADFIPTRNWCTSNTMKEYEIENSNKNLNVNTITKMNKIEKVNKNFETMTTRKTKETEAEKGNDEEIARDPRGKANENEEGAGKGTRRDLEKVHVAIRSRAHQGGLYEQRVLEPSSEHASSRTSTSSTSLDRQYFLEHSVEHSVGNSFEHAAGHITGYSAECSTEEYSVDLSTDQGSDLSYLHSLSPRPSPPHSTSSHPNTSEVSRSLGHSSSGSCLSSLFPFVDESREGKQCSD